MKAKISLCVFFILSASTDNTRKVFKHLRRMRGKYLSTHGECAESSSAYIENMSNQGYFRYTKLSPNARKVFKRIWRMHGKNLCVHGEDAKRVLAYSHNTPRDIKVRISQLIIIIRMKKNLCSFYLY